MTDKWKEPDGFSQLLGVPYKPHGRDIRGMDCLGGVIAYFGLTRRSFPDYGQGLVLSDPDSINGVVCEHRNKAVRLLKPEPEALLLFNQGGIFANDHLGVYLTGDWFFHVMEGCGGIKSNIRSRTFSSQLEGYYRWIW